MRESLQKIKNKNKKSKQVPYVVQIEDDVFFLWESRFQPLFWPPVNNKREGEEKIEGEDMNCW